MMDFLNEADGPGEPDEQPPRAEQQRLQASSPSDFEGSLTRLQRGFLESARVSFSAPPDVTLDTEGDAVLVKARSTDSAAVILTRVCGLAVENSPDLGPNTNTDNGFLWTPAASVLTGVCEHQASILRVIVGNEGDVGLYFGVKASGPRVLEAIRRANLAHHSLVACLQANYRDIRLAHLKGDALLQQVLRPVARFCAGGVLLGNPSLGHGRDPREMAADRLIRALGNSCYCFWIEAQPVSRALLVRAHRWLGREIATAHRQVRGTTNKTLRSNLHLSEEALDVFAARYEELLEIAWRKVDAGLREGMWNVTATLVSESEEKCERAGSLLRSVFGGPNAKPEPLRFRFSHSVESSAHPSALALARLQTPEMTTREGDAVNERDPLGLGVSLASSPLCSSDLGFLMELPCKETPGYRITQPRDFAQDVPPCGSERLEVGRVLGSFGPTKGTFAVELDDLPRHALIAGVTGSGKTNTAMHLLRQLWKDERGVPFLVIEPAKAHYRSLLGALRPLQVFAPGHGQVAPFRMNPFEFPPGYDAQAHIAHLYTVFNAAFVLYAPMPYVLERALYEVYEDRGWDLSAGRHSEIRSRKDERSSWNWLAFPTLTELYHKIGVVVDRLGYDQRVRMDVTAGLQARIDSLRAGQKGQTFDCRRSVPFEEILAKPTVIELSHLGSDEERAFLMGLLLMRLYETLVVARESDRLRHVTLIEEAHRLLTRTSTEVSAESANTKGQAVEAFCNILAEIRAYGEGVIVAEQIPSKLASDVLKNTNLKILHRIVAADDRELLGNTMNLQDSQKAAVTVLRRGEAAAFAEGWETAALVKVPRSPLGRKASDTRVARNSDSFYDSHPGILGQLAGCDRCNAVCQYASWAKRSATTPEASAVIWSYALACAGQSSPTSHWQECIGRLWHAVTGEPALPPKREDQAWCLFTVASDWTFWFFRGRDVSLEDLEALLTCFLRVADADRKGELHSESTKRSVLTPFRSRSRVLLQRRSGPLRGCIHCQVQCQYEPLGQLIARERTTRAAIDSAYSAKDHRSAVASVCRELSQRVLLAPGKTATDDLARCIFAHVAEWAGAKDPAGKLAKIFGKS